MVDPMFPLDSIVVRNSSPVEGGQTAYLVFSGERGMLLPRDVTNASCVRVVADTPENRAESGGYFTADWEWRKS